MKISIFEIREREQGHFSELMGRGHELSFSEKPLTLENAREYADSDIVVVSIYSKPGPETLSRLENLKFVGTRSTGFDHIDLNYCMERGIAVANVPFYAERTVAEHVFALLLAISHKIEESLDRTRKGDFSQKGLTGFDLYGKRLGVLGTGNIGQAVIGIARGFGMDVVAYDIKPGEELARELGFRYAPLNEVLASSDILTVHVPSTPKTHHFLSDNEFAMMKPCTVLINTSRGEVVDTKALLKALSEGKVAAAGLDVLEEEPVIREEAELLTAIFEKEHELETLLADHILLRLRNVKITPHNAFNTMEAIKRIYEVTVENILGFIEGKPKNLVAPAPRFVAP